MNVISGGGGVDAGVVGRSRRHLGVGQGCSEGTDAGAPSATVDQNG